MSFNEKINFFMDKSIILNYNNSKEGGFLTNFISAAFYEDDVDVKGDFAVNNAGKVHLSGYNFLNSRPLGRMDYQLLYIKAGEAEFENDEGKFRLKSGQVFLYRPHEKQIYWYIPAPESVVYWVHFGGRLTETILSTAGLKKSVLDFGSAPEFENTVSFMIKNFRLGDSFSNMLCCSKLLELICEIGIKNSGAGKDCREPETEKMISYISAHYSENISNSELAKKANMSLSHFLRQFKKATGTSPVAFRNEQRIKAARSLILNSELNISQIAFTVGFSDSLYFSRAFKKSVGMSPMEFKRSKQH